MQERNVQVDGIHYRHTFSWVSLFQGFRVAFSPRMWLIASLGVLLWVLGEWVIAQLGFAPQDEGPTLAEMEQWPWNEHADLFTPPPAAEERPAPGDAEAAPLVIPPPKPNSTLNPFAWVGAENRNRFLAPVLAPIVDPLLGMFQPDREFTWSNLTFHLTRLLWAFCIWSFVAGLLTRKAALKYSTEYSLGIREGARYLLPRWGQYFRAGSLPLGGIAIFWLVCYLGGLFGRIPVLGEWFVGLFWIVALLLGFFMALMVIGLLVGWPMMIATISVEDTESFDGFSRSFNYTFNRPWHFGWLSLVSIMYGAIVIAVVTLIVSLLFSTTLTATASGLGETQTAELVKGLSPGVDDAPVWSEIAGLWSGFVAVLFTGFLYSLFWTMATLVYLLLRYYDDGMDTHEIAIPIDSDAAAAPAVPTVGVAASDQPVVERPPGEINVVQISDSPDADAAEETTDQESQQEEVTPEKEKPEEMDATEKEAAEEKSGEGDESKES